MDDDDAQERSSAVRNGLGAGPTVGGGTTTAGTREAGRGSVGEDRYTETYALSRYDPANMHYLPPTPLAQEDGEDDRGVKLQGWYFASQNAQEQQVDKRRVNRMAQSGLAPPTTTHSSTGFLSFLTERPRKYEDIISKGREGIKTGLDSPLHNSIMSESGRGYRKGSSSSLDPMHRPSANHGEDHSWIDDVLRLRGVAVSDDIEGSRTTDAPDGGMHPGVARQAGRTASVNSYRSNHSSNSRSSFDTIHYRRSFDISGRIETPSPSGSRTALSPTTTTTGPSPRRVSSESETRANTADPAVLGHQPFRTASQADQMAQPQPSRPTRIARLDSALEVELSAPGQYK